MTLIDKAIVALNDMRAANPDPDFDQIMRAVDAIRFPDEPMQVGTLAVLHSGEGSLATVQNAEIWVRGDIDASEDTECWWNCADAEWCEWRVIAERALVVPHKKLTFYVPAGGAS